MRQLAAFLAAIILFAGCACSRSTKNGAGMEGDKPAGSIVGGSAQAPGTFLSTQLGFSVRYPRGDQPTLHELGKLQTAIGAVTEFSLYTGVGDTAYDVTVSVYPPGKLSPDIAGLLKVTRDAALQKPDTSLVSEKRVTVKTNRAGYVQAHFMDVKIRDGRVFRVLCFYDHFGYVISAGGRAGDPTLNRQTFDEFVASFRLLDN